MGRQIDADAIQTSLAVFMTENSYLNMTALDALKMVSGWVDEAPTAQPEVRCGKWIEYETSSYNGIDDNGEVKWSPKKFFRCSICRKGTAVRSNFCPNCGARMDLED